MKKCSKCGIEKPRSEFHAQKAMKDGLKHQCKTCATAIQRERYQAKPPEYCVWYDMRSRCYQPSTNGYERYGGRGIRVDSRWSKFKYFFADMGSRPTPQHQLDRIDNDGDYTPENCQWITGTENVRKSKIAKLDMEKAREIRMLWDNGIASQSQLAKDYEVHNATIHYITSGVTWKEEEIA